MSTTADSWHQSEDVPSRLARPDRLRARASLEEPDEALERQTAFLHLLRYLDWPLLFFMAALTTIGLIGLAGASMGGAGLGSVVERQLTWTGISLCGLALALIFDYRWFARLAPLGYAINLALLLLVLFVGTRVNGSTSWFRLGPLSFQPAETMKVITVLLLAQWFAHRPEGMQRLVDLLVPIVIVLPPVVLILRQPDLGTAFLFAFIFGAMLFWAGTARWVWFTLWAAGIGMAAAVIPFLRSYQKERLLTFIDPTRDPLGSGYNVLQSMIAAGAGGIWGRGWGEGSQAVHRFLPEARTDFIFASTVEQFGLVGALVVLALYGLLLWRMLECLRQARDRFGGLVIAGIAALLGGHVLMNVGMNIGFVPVTGLPLPFLSYGGTFLLATFLMMGLVMNISMRRFVFH
jgi:rod shape determining protein RodA